MIEVELIKTHVQFFFSIKENGQATNEAMNETTLYAKDTKGNLDSLAYKAKDAVHKKLEEEAPKPNRAERRAKPKK